MPVGVYILALAAFVVGVQGAVFTGLLANVAGDLGVSLGVAGQLVTAFAITSAVASPLVVSVFAKLDRMAVLLCALTGVGLINLATAALPVFEAFLGARIVVAVAGAAVMPMAGAIAASLVAPKRQGQALGLVLSGLTVAFVIGVPIGTAIVGAFGWRATFVFAGVVALAVVPVIAWKVPATGVGEVRPVADWRVIRKPVVPYSLTLIWLAFVAAYPVIAFIGPLITELTGLTGGAIGAMQSAIGIGSIVGLAVGAKLADTRGYVSNMGVMYAALAAALALWIALTSVPLAGVVAIAATFAALVLTAATLIAPSPAIEKALVGADPSQSALTLAMNTSVLYAGQGAGAALGGFVLGAAGFTGLAVAATAVALIALVVAVIGGRRSGAA